MVKIELLIRFYFLLGILEIETMRDVYALITSLSPSCHPRLKLDTSSILEETSIAV